MKKKYDEQLARKLKQLGKSYKEVAILIGCTKSTAVALCSAKHPRTETKCAWCGAENGRLIQHHINYETDETVTVCDSCHVKHHQKDVVYRGRASKYPWNLLDWRIPNLKLSEIWNIPTCYVAEYRRKHRKGRALWNTKPKYLYPPEEFKALVIKHRTAAIMYFCSGPIFPVDKQ